MLADYIEVEETMVPKKLTDEKVNKWATELGEDFDYYYKASQVLREEIWPACDKAFHCIRDLDAIPTMKLIDDGMLGESDVRVAIKSARDALIMTLMPPNEAWLEPASQDEDDTEDILQKVKDFCIDQNQVAKTRESMSIFSEQLLGRGTSAVGVLYNRKYAKQRISKKLADTMHGIAEAQAELSGTEAPSRREFTKITKLKKVAEGPKTYPVDMHRLFLDPTADLSVDSDVSVIYVMFKSLTELKGAKDEETGEPLYDHKALEDVDEVSYSEYYKQYPGGLETTNLLGLNPECEENATFVPVYMFHRQMREFEDGSLFVDKFFYAARSSAGTGTWRIIRIQDNPSEFGDKPFYIAACDRWLNTAYGVGLIEKSLSALRAKDLLAALSLNAHVYNTMPPVAYFQGIFKHDKPSFMPNHWQPIVNRAGIGLDFFKPFPVNPNGIIQNAQDQRLLAEKIVAQTGSSGAMAFADPNKSLSKSKTATEVRQQTTDSIVAQQALVERISDDVLQPLVQTIYNLARQHFTSGADYIKRGSNGERTAEKLDFDDIDRDRSIMIVGRRGLDDKAHELANLMEAMKVMGNGQFFETMPTARIMFIDLVIKILSKFGFPMKEEYKMDPAEIIARDPKVAMQMLAEILQTPEGKQVALQILQNDPEVQQGLQDIVSAAAQAGREEITGVLEGEEPQQ